jgi:hypothetical protein
MISLRDSLTLAVTKLRLRRVRLAVTLIVSGLLFAVLAGGSLVVRGGINSVKSFADEGFSNRFMVDVNPAISYTGNSKELIARAEQIQKRRLEEMAAEARRLGLEFDPKSQPQITREPGGPGGPEEVALDFNHPAVHQAVAETTQSGRLRQDIESWRQTYNIQSIYEGYRQVYVAPSAELSPIVGGKEVRSDFGSEGRQAVSPDRANPFSSFGLEALDKALLETAGLPGADLDYRAGQPIPIMVPIDAAEHLLGLKQPAKTAPAEEQLNHLGMVRDKALDFEFEVCYRNPAASQLRQVAQQQQSELMQRRNDASYQRPALMYKEEAEPCRIPMVERDVRSAAEKDQDARQKEFEQKFGEEPPEVIKISFRVAGVLPRSLSIDGAFEPEALIGGLLSGGLGQGWLVPAEAVKRQPQLAKSFMDPVAVANGGQRLVVEFANRPDQKRFMNERNCEPEFPKSPREIQAPGLDPFAGCVEQKKFLLMPYGNAISALYDFEEGVNKVFRIILLVLAGLSALIMMGTVGKVIADSRKETSVFRALGAKRTDIAQVYLLYAGLLGSGTFMVAMGLGTLAAAYLDWRFGNGLTIQALLAFNSQDLEKQFNLWFFHGYDLLKLYGFVLAAGLVSAAIPLLTNLRRNPIKDMRDE